NPAPVRPGRTPPGTRAAPAKPASCSQPPRSAYLKTRAEPKRPSETRRSVLRNRHLNNVHDQDIPGAPPHFVLVRVHGYHTSPGRHLDGPGRPIARRAADAKGLGPAPGKSAKSHALHPALHAPSPGHGCRRPGNAWSDNRTTARQPV